MTENAKIGRHMASDLAEAKMIVRRDDGLFRHIDWSAPRAMSRLTLITWPYNLLVAGSHGSYHFERYGDDTEDMLNWLRVSHPNPDSWASKLVNGRDTVTEYDRGKLIAEIHERVEEAIRDGWAPAGLEDAVYEQILNSGWLDEEQTALRMVDEFEHGVTHRAECSCGAYADHDDYTAAACWNAMTHKGRGAEHQVRIRQTGGFDFTDVSDWNVRKLNYHYVWTCHAMVWAAAQYDAARTTAAVTA